jgi:hypothetical protein
MKPDRPRFEDEPKEYDWRFPPRYPDAPRRLPGQVLATMLFIIAFLILVSGFAGLLAEGPHGPNGEITGDPGAPLRLLIAIAAFSALMWAGTKCWKGWER